MGKTGATSRVVINNVRVFDGVRPELVHTARLYLKDGRIAGPEERPDPASVVIEGGDRVVIPGLSDAHTHLYAAGSTEADLLMGPTARGYYNAAAEAERMLMRGFTTVRDMGGDVVALKEAIDAGGLRGPRIYPSQAALSQTSGHGDFSTPYEPSTVFGGVPSRAEEVAFMRVADGRDRVLAAAREQLKRGASQIKVMAGGGVASAYDPLDVIQFTSDELRAAVEAAADWGTYVSAHVYTDAGIRRAVEAGVKSIEHAQLASEETIALLAADPKNPVWLCTQPFLENDHHYASPVSAAKNRRVCEGVAQTLTWARAYGVKTAFGTDLLLNPSESGRQIEMFTRLATAFGYRPFEALTMATSTNAELFRLAGERDPYKAAPLGVIQPGAWADLLVVEGDPTKDLSVLGDPDTNLAVIIKDGRIHKNQLS